jgi:hypothetical protein
MSEPFGAEFNWCDSWCERCPLREECPIVRAERQRRWVHEARGKDPDDLRVVLEDFDKDLSRTLELLRETAAQEGIDIDDIDTRDVPPTPIAALRLQRAGMKYSLATKHALGATPPVLARSDDPHLEELIRQSNLIARKCARVGGYMNRAGGPDAAAVAWMSDAVPNLLLLELVLRRARAAVDALLDPTAAAVFHAIHADLDRSLAPLFAAIPREARAEIDARIASGQAPSPFVLAPSNQ